MNWVDHNGWWADTLRDRLPAVLFDAHVHIGLPDAVGPITPARALHAVTTYTHFSLEELRETAGALYGGKTMAGWFAFPFPQREVQIEAANAYLLEALKQEPRLHGFLLAEPDDVRPTAKAYDRAMMDGLQVVGVKPYADRLGKDNFDAKMAEFLQDDLLQFMHHRRLIMMLHTSGVGIGDPAVRHSIESMVTRYPNITVILAHLGRYVQPRQFLDLLDCGLLERCPRIYLGMSSATEADLYRRILERTDLRRRLLFGSDLPFGLITGVERWSDSRGAVFLSRDDYPWSDPEMNAQFADERPYLTYNTYHVMQAFLSALDALDLPPEESDAILADVFCNNAQRLLVDNGV